MREKPGDKGRYWGKGEPWGGRGGERRAWGMGEPRVREELGGRGGAWEEGRAWGEESGGSLRFICYLPFEKAVFR